MTWLLVLGSFATLVGCGSAGETRAPSANSNQARQREPSEPRASEPASAAVPYTCSMHPQVQHAGPGPCPICGMDLVPQVAERAARDEGAYTCSMHPHIASPGPGTCPICGMDLVPRAAISSEPDLPAVDPSCAQDGCLRAAVRRLLDAALGADDSSGMIRAAAVRAASDDRLLEALRDGDGLVRGAAAVEVARRHLAATDALRAAASDERLDPQGLSRMAAIDALAQLGDPGAAERLRPFFGDESPLVRSIAVSFAERLPTLRAALVELRGDDPSEEVRDQAELSLAMLGEPSARAAVSRRTDVRSFRVRARLDPSFRERLAEIAASDEPPRGLEFVRREGAAFALLDVGDERGRHAIHRMLAQGSTPQELPLLQTLHRYASDSDLDVVVRRLAHLDPLVRVEAAAIWWQLQGEL